MKVDDRQPRRSNSVAAKSVTITVERRVASHRLRLRRRLWREYPARRAACASRGTSPRTRDLPSKSTTCTIAIGRDRTGFVGITRAWTRSTIITGLKAGTRYEVQVRARSDEGTGEWSRCGRRRAEPGRGQQEPSFLGRVAHVERSRKHSRRTPMSAAPVAASDRDGDTLTYTLEGTDADSFDILVDLRRRPDTDKRGAEPRGEVELLGDGAGEGRQGRNGHGGQPDDQRDGR